MKDIKKYYQDLIKDINLANDKIVGGLKNHITWLESKVLNLQDEIEKLKSGSQLQSEIDEYNRLEAQKNMNLEDEIVELKAENNRLKKAYSDLEKAYKLTVDTPAPAKKGSRKAGSKSKTVVVYCKDCGTYFQAKSKIAKYCSSCRDKRAKASRAKWLAKQKEQK